MTAGTPNQDVVICYSHRDKRWFKRIDKQLRPLFRAGVSVLSDKKVLPDLARMNQPSATIERARVALLLISPDFLASETIERLYLSPIMDKARAGKIVVLWVLVKPCAYQAAGFAAFKPAIDARISLEALDVENTASAEAALVDLGLTILDSLNRPGDVSKGAEELRREEEGAASLVSGQAPALTSLVSGQAPALAMDNTKGPDSTVSSASVLLEESGLKNKGTPFGAVDGPDKASKGAALRFIPPPVPRTHYQRGWRLLLPRNASIGPLSEEIMLALAPLSKLRNPGRCLSPLFVDFKCMPIEDPETQAGLNEIRDLLNDDDVVMAGRAEDLPFFLQNELSLLNPVGRLSLETADEYAAYAEKVIRAETTRPSASLRPALTFAPAFDRATSLLRDQLMAPVCTSLGKTERFRRVDALFGPEATRDRLFQLISREIPDSPSLLFLGSHGLHPTSPAHPDVGAIADDRMEFIYGRDVDALPSAAFNGIVLLLASNSAGRTGIRPAPPLPGTTEATREQADQVARLGNAFLTHPRGALAVYGMVEVLRSLGLIRAGTFGKEKEPVLDPIPFIETVLSLARGRPQAIRCDMSCRKPGLQNGCF